MRRGATAGYRQRYRWPLIVSALRERPRTVNEIAAHIGIENSVARRYLLRLKAENLARVVKDDAGPFPALWGPGRAASSAFVTTPHPSWE